MNASDHDARHFALILEQGDRLACLEAIDIGLAILAFEHRLTVLLRGPARQWARMNQDTGKPELPALRALSHHGAEGLWIEQSKTDEANASSDEWIKELLWIEGPAMEACLRHCDEVIHV